MLKNIFSFGYKYGENAQNECSIVIDIRQMFANPYSVLRLRKMSGLNKEVQDYIRTKTTNFQVLYEHVKERATAPGVEYVFIGCYGGRHRGPCIAEMLGKDLGVRVDHLHINKGH